jgi:hypothetical protein
MEVVEAGLGGVLRRREEVESGREGANLDCASRERRQNIFRGSQAESSERAEGESKGEDEGASFVFTHNNTLHRLGTSNERP